MEKIQNEVVRETNNNPEQSYGKMKEKQKQAEPAQTELPAEQAAPAPEQSAPEQPTVRAYQAVDPETGEIYSRILYNEGFPLNIRANMKFGRFVAGDSDDDGRKRVTIIPIALRFFRAQMFLNSDDMQKIEKDDSGKELEKSIKNWVEVFWLDRVDEAEDIFIVASTLFKTWGQTEIKNALMRPRPIKNHKGRMALARPMDLQLTITTERKNENGQEFFIPKIEKVETAPHDIVRMLEDFVADHKIYSLDTVQNNIRFPEYYALQGAPVNWFMPKDIAALSAGEVIDTPLLPVHEPETIEAETVDAEDVTVAETQPNE